MFVNVAPGEFWLLNYVRWRDLGGMDVDIEGGTMIGGTISGEFSGYELVDAAQVEGIIDDPDAIVPKQVLRTAYGADCERHGRPAPTANRS